MENEKLTEQELEQVTGGAYIVEDRSGKTYQLIQDDEDPIGTYEVSEEGAEDPNAREKSLGR